MYISLNSGVVLSVFLDGRNISEIKKEVSSRIANVGTGGKLLGRDLRVIACFDYQGKEIF